MGEDPLKTRDGASTARQRAAATTVSVCSPQSLARNISSIDPEYGATDKKTWSCFSGGEQKSQKRKFDTPYTLGYVHSHL